MTPKDFVEAYFLEAYKSELLTGVPTLVTLSQAALESSWGKRAVGNNFFGIKAGTSWQGETQDLRTWEYFNGKKKRVIAKFRKYNNPSESFADHGKLLRERWHKAFRFSDPVEFIKSVQFEHRYKYATDPLYVDKIQKLAKRISKIILKMEME